MAMSKLDRMSEITAMAAERDLGELESLSAELSATIAEAAEALRTIGNNAAEALAFHEERQWEDRDSMLVEGDGQVEELSDQLDRIEELLPQLKEVLDTEFPPLREVIEKVRTHNSHLIEA